MVFVCIFFCFLRFSLFYQINRVSKTKKVLCVGEVQLYNVDFERQKLFLEKKNLAVSWNNLFKCPTSTYK